MEAHELLRKYRLIRDMTQTELATKIGMTQSGYAKLERGEYKIDIEKWSQLVKALRVPYYFYDNPEEVAEDVEQQNMIYDWERLNEIALLFKDRKNLTENQKKIAIELFETAFHTIEKEKELIKQTLSKDNLEEAIKRHGLDFLYK